MAHVKKKYSGLWLPENKSVDLISPQKMFMDNIEQMETNHIASLKKIKDGVATIAALKAIDTSDTTIFVDDTIIMVKENTALYMFNRISTATDNSGNIVIDGANTVIAPSAGGGRWLMIKSNASPITVEQTLTLTVAGWSGSTAPFTQDITASILKNQHDIEVGVAPGATNTQYLMAASCILRATKVSGTTVTVSALDEKPTADIPIYVKILKTIGSGSGPLN